MIVDDLEPRLPRRVPISSESRAAHERTDRARDALRRQVSANAPRKLTLDEMRAWPDPPDKQDARLARTSTNSPPDKAQLSSGIEVWVADLIAARGARKDRKAMIAPHHRRDLRSPMFELVNLHLRKLARRTLNDRAKRGERWATHSELTAALYEYVLTECRHVIYFHEYGNPRASARERRPWLDGERAAEAVSRSAATYALAGWTPLYMMTRQRRGRLGGQISKRPPTWTGADLDALGKLAHLPNMQARADALGRSLRTTERMWKALRDRA